MHCFCRTRTGWFLSPWREKKSVRNSGGGEVLCCCLLPVNVCSFWSDLWFSRSSSTPSAYFFPSAFDWEFGEGRIIVVVGPSVIP